jgi:hypothetical protein
MADQQQHTKDVLASRFVERALSYSWIKYGWDTASKTYETVKQSTSLTKYGCELVEGNLSKVAHSPIAEGTVSLFAPLIVIADEFSVRQLDKVEKGAQFGQQVVRKAIVDPFKAVASIPSRLLDRAEALVDYYLPEEKHKGDEGPTAGKPRRDSKERVRASSVGRLFDLTLTTVQRTYARLGYENLKSQATEKLQSYETLNDLIIYMKTSDPEKRDKLVRQGRDIYWNFRNNYKAIFIQSARAVVQPCLVAPTLKIYHAVHSLLERILLRGPFSPHLSRPSANAA